MSISWKHLRLETMIKDCCGKIVSKDLLKISTRDSFVWQAFLFCVNYKQTTIWQLHHIPFLPKPLRAKLNCAGAINNMALKPLKRWWSWSGSADFSKIGMAKGEDLCLVKLSKSYEDIERLLNLWNETDRHSNELIQSLTSPLEQLHSCEKACFKRSPLVDFDGLKEKLQHKLLKQTEIIMAKLQDDM